MSQLLSFIIKLVELIKPKHNHWVVRVLLIGGISMLSLPWWIQYLNVALDKSYQIQLPIEIAGWILLALAIALHIWNRVEERASEASNSSTSREADRDCTTLNLLFENIHTPTVDEFIERGKCSYVLDRTLHFWEGFRHIVESSNFHIYDKELNRKIKAFYSAWDKSLSFGEYFTPTNNPGLYRFDTIMDLPKSSRHEEAQEEFIEAVWDCEGVFREFIGYVRENYPLIDIQALDNIAWNNYVDFMREQVQT